MEHKSKICLQDLHFFIMNKKQKNIDVEVFLEKKIWNLLKFSKQTDTLLELAIKNPNYKNFNMKSFF